MPSEFRPALDEHRFWERLDADRRELLARDRKPGPEEACLGPGGRTRWALVTDEVSFGLRLCKLDEIFGRLIFNSRSDDPRVFRAFLGAAGMDTQAFAWAESIPIGRPTARGRGKRANPSAGTRQD